MKILSLLFISFCLLLSGCFTGPSTNSSQTQNDLNLLVDTSPLVNDMDLPDLVEEVESDWIYLSYTDAQNHLATACYTGNPNNIIVTIPCQCLDGVCRLKVKSIPDFNGPASFTFSVTANNLTSIMAKASFQVRPLSDSPVAIASSFTVEKNSSYTSDGSLKPHLSGTDPDGDTLTCSNVTAPLKGAVVIHSNCSFTYTPDVDYEGVDSFTFRVRDGVHYSTPQMVSITVARLNHPPVATESNLTSYYNTSSAISLIASDPDFDALTFNILTTPQFGTLSGTGAQRSYKPKKNYMGPDSFTFSVSDGSLTSNIVTVSINVTNPTVFLSSLGNDVTGEISQSSKPFKTAQKAVEVAMATSPTFDVPTTIYVGVGQFGDVTLMSNFGENIKWKGINLTSSFIGNINANGKNGLIGKNIGDPVSGSWNGGNGENAYNVSINSDFKIKFGMISAKGGDGGLHYSDTHTFAAKPGLPGNGGSLQLMGHFSEISVTGGNGHGGGLGGNVKILTGSTVSSIDVSGGSDLCSLALSCYTSVDSQNGGTVTTEANTIVYKYVMAKGGSNNGSINLVRKKAGSGGNMNCSGKVLGNMNATGGNSYDSIVGAGGNVLISSTGEISGPEINVMAGIFSNSGLRNAAGKVEVFGTATTIMAKSLGLSCLDKAGSIIIRGSGAVENIYADSGISQCIPSTAGLISISGTVSGVASVSGGSSNLFDVSPGSGGQVTLYKGSSVNIVNAGGGKAVSPSCKDGGSGGRIVIYPSSSYNLSNLTVEGGPGDVDCSKVKGPNGTIIYH
jgi:hypothetical protein